MKAWKKFEIECLKYLKNQYSSNIISFKPTGFSNSNSSDILVLRNGIPDFSIEAKMPIAQSGQFVLISENNKFRFSNRNKSSITRPTNIIIDYINNNYEIFQNETTSGIDLDMDEKIFADWIFQYYEEAKNVKFIISRSKNNYVIIPINKIGKYFDISAKFRIKKSGSNNLPASHEPLLLNLLKNYPGTHKLSRSGKKCYLSTNGEFIDSEKIVGEKATYMMKKSEDRYLIRKLSNTFNSNVIFSIHLKENQNKNDLNKFIKSLKKD